VDGIPDSFGRLRGVERMVGALLLGFVAGVLGRS